MLQGVLEEKLVITVKAPFSYLNLNNIHGHLKLNDV